MPHAHIKHLPIPLNEGQKTHLAEDRAAMNTGVFGGNSEVVSIALEPVAPQDWGSQVKRPHIIGRSSLLMKMPFPADRAATPPAISGASL